MYDKKSTLKILIIFFQEVKTQIAGLTIVLDCTGFGLSHLKHLGVNEIKLASAFLSGSFPLWTRRIHFVNQPRLFAVLMNIVRPFLSENAKDVLNFHGQVFLIICQFDKTVSQEWSQQPPLSSSQGYIAQRIRVMSMTK